MNLTAVIMAGGRGERFWPRSRTDKPKQFLSLTADKETMLQKTVNRLRPLLDLSDIYIVTNQRYQALVQEQLPDLPPENILLEPCSRNTAPCIAMAAAIIQKKYADAMMLVLPSDHLIRYESLYLDTLRQAISVAEVGRRLVTIGIPPTYPETGYGYIRFANSETPGVYNVEKFVEKPDLDTAKEYLASHCYLWNSGMFVWKISTIQYNLETFLPSVFTGSQEIAASYGTDAFEAQLEQVYAEMPSESIDYGIMEKADQIFTIPGSFGWDDVGNWRAIERINKTNEYGNYIEGDVITVNTQRSTICGQQNKLIAAVGVEDLIVIDTEDAMLICAKDSTQDVKTVIQNLKICNRDALL
jgi:mannose-1-phosphate guanylyltransferase